MLFLGTTWGLLAGGHQTVFPGTYTPLAWPYLMGQQVFYSLGIPAVSPVYFYTLGVMIWSLVFFAVGSVFDMLWGVKQRAGKQSQRVRGY